MSDITEDDIYAWLDSEVEQVEHYDPAKHITAEVFAERRGMSISWARRELAKLVKVGKLKRIGVLLPSGKAGTGYVRVVLGSKG